MMLGLATAAILSMAPADAPPPPAEITVQAQEKNLVRSFVQQMVDPTPDGQIARWPDRLCSGVIGIASDQAEVLNGHIAQVATLAGVRLEPAGCHPTLLILFTDRPDTMAEGIAGRFPTALAREGRAVLHRFRHSNRPVRWISTTALTGGDGANLQPGFAGDADINVQYASRLRATTRAMLSFMLVIVDSRHLAHRTVGQLGDYLGMVALARPAQEAKPSARSALALFEDEAVTGLTEIDRRYLAALYQAPADQDAAAEASAIRAGMVRSPRP